MFEQLLAKYASDISKIVGEQVSFYITPIAADAKAAGKWREAPEGDDPVHGAYIMDMNIWLHRGKLGHGGIIAQCKLNQLPGCCGVLVSNGAHVNTLRGRGIGTAMARLRLDIAKMFGYTTLLCTDVMDNTPQRKILTKLGYTDLFKFKNRRTNNTVAISAINLTQPPSNALVGVAQDQPAQPRG